MSHLLTRIEGITDRFAITFDDGPSPTWTPLVLEALAAAGARATFFPLAPNVRRRPELAARVAAAGHELGVHGEWHLPPPILPWRVLRLEIMRGIDAARSVNGVMPRCYRPPYDVLTAAQAARVRALGLIPVTGDVDSRDYAQPPVARMVERVMRDLRAGSIVIFHDSSGIGDFSRRRSVEGAARVLAAAAERGLRAVGVGELLDAGRSR